MVGSSLPATAANVKIASASTNRSGVMSRQGTTKTEDIKSVVSNALAGGISKKRPMNS